MKKLTVVRTNTEEMKRRPSRSNWAWNAAMTDAEIQAAVASDPDECDLGTNWMDRAKVVSQAEKRALLQSSKTKQP